MNSIGIMFTVLQQTPKRLITTTSRPPAIHRTIAYINHRRNMSTAPDATQWWSAFPEAKASASTIENTEVLQLLESTAAAGKHSTRDFLLVDVRRTDWEGGTVSSSINLPAQSFYPTRPIVYQLVKQAGIKRVIFYCGTSLVTWSLVSPATNSS